MRGRVSMKKSVTGLAVVTSLFSTAAFAADMPVKARPPVVAAWSWTGFYFGGEAGGKWTRDEWTATSLRDGNPTNGAVFGPIDTSSPSTFTTSSARVGVFVGYNWQFNSRFVAGIEGDWAWTNGSSG